MANYPKYYIIDATALPEVFHRVAEAKHLLDTGEAATVGEATDGRKSAAAPFISIGTRFSPSRI